MPLVKKATLSAAKIAANRKNARKSSRGPCIPAGKERAKYSALKHGLYLQACRGGYREQSLRQTMIPASREDRDEFERLHYDLVSLWQPRDAFPRMLVEQLRDLMWKQARITRALDAALVHQVKAMEFERAQRAKEIGCKTFQGSEAELTKAGLWGSQDRPSKFEEILVHLGTLTDLVNRHDFSQNQEVPEALWPGADVARSRHHEYVPLLSLERWVRHPGGAWRAPARPERSPRRPTPCEVRQIPQAGNGASGPGV